MSATARAGAIWRYGQNPTWMQHLRVAGLFTIRW
jgi:hypothetical protein